MNTTTFTDRHAAKRATRTAIYGAIADRERETRTREEQTNRLLKAANAEVKRLRDALDESKAESRHLRERVVELTEALKEA